MIQNAISREGGEQALAFSGNLVTHPTSPYKAWGLSTVLTLREGRDWQEPNLPTGSPATS